ncbi:Hypp6160 [Branchiostoma lanceolatum]|uniref:Hypp6160 protein n=1 Tax=Branchiostoma lanceolatum TaxID=7740 RepID=A0A8J9VJ19_BRALA|nr:Hypp6160 [Branchiostoma lanceolatum]
MLPGNDPVYFRPTDDFYSLLVNKDRQGNAIHRDVEVVSESRGRTLLQPPPRQTSRGEEKEEDSVHVYRIWLFYDEVDRKRPGCKIAVPNLAARIALSNSPMGLSPFREMTATLDIPVPSQSCLQKLASQYSDTMVEDNEADMQSWAKAVQLIQEKKTSEPNPAIPGQADTRYQSFRHIKTKVSHITTDGDAHFSRGMASIMKVKAGQTTKSLSDYVHLSRGISRQVSRTARSKGMFSGRLQVNRNRVRDRYWDDLYASAIHSSNNGTGSSIRLKREAAGIPLPLGSPTLSVLEKMDKGQCNEGISSGTLLQQGLCPLHVKVTTEVNTSTVELWELREDKNKRMKEGWSNQTGQCVRRTSYMEVVQTV